MLRQLAEGGFIITRQVGTTWEWTGFAYAEEVNGDLIEYYVLANATQTNAPPAPSVYEYAPPGPSEAQQIRIEKTTSFDTTDLESFLDDVDAYLSRDKWNYIVAPTVKTDPPKA